MCKVELLAQKVVLVNVLRSLDFDIQLVPIHDVRDGVAQMLELVHPWQWISTEQKAGKLPWLLEKCHQFSLALSRIWIRGELQVVTGSIFLTGVQHVLQGTEGGGQQPVVIAVAKDSMIPAKYPTTSSSLFQDGKQVLTIEAVCNG